MTCCQYPYDNLMLDFPHAYHRFKKYILLVKPLFSLCLGILNIYPSLSKSFKCLLTVRSESFVTCAIVLTEGKQDHVFLLAYCKSALYTVTLLLDKLESHIF